MRKIWVCLFALSLSAGSAYADRFPITNNFARDITLRPVGSLEAGTTVIDDTYTFTMLTQAQLYFVDAADTNVSISNKVSTSHDSGLFLAGSQYAFDFQTYRPGDTIVARCVSCGVNEAVTVRIRIYPGGNR